jgi:hypothetical protein
MLSLLSIYVRICGISLTCCAALSLPCSIFLRFVLTRWRYGDTPLANKLKLSLTIWQLGKNNLSTLGACCRPLLQQAPTTPKEFTQFGL